MTKTISILTILGLALVLPLVGCQGEKSQEDLDKEAKSTIEKIEKCVSDKDFDKAEAHLKTLESTKDKCSEAVQKQIETARTTLDAAKKAAGGLKMPELPGT